MLYPSIPLLQPAKMQLEPKSINKLPSLLKLFVALSFL